MENNENKTAKNPIGETDKYEQSAQDFLKKTGATLTITYLKTGKHFPGDKENEPRDIYTFTIKRGNRAYAGEFGNSINASCKWTFEGKKYHSDEQAREAIKAKLGAYAAAHLKGYARENKNFEELRAYDILSCLTKSEPGSFEDFCSEYGYNTDSRSAERSYQAVKTEYEGLLMLFTDAELLEMGEIN